MDKSAILDIFKIFQTPQHSYTVRYLNTRFDQRTSWPNSKSVSRVNIANGRAKRLLLWMYFTEVTSDVFHWGSFRMFLYQILCLPNELQHDLTFRDFFFNKVLRTGEHLNWFNYQIVLRPEDPPGIDDSSFGYTVNEYNETLLSP